MSPSEVPPRFAPAALLRSAAAVAALRSLAGALRQGGYANVPAGDLERLALGHAAPPPDGVDVAALRDAGACDGAGDGLVRLRFALLSMGGRLVVVPRDTGDHDQVYVHLDTAWLLEAATARLATGDRAVAELACGAGAVAAALAAPGRLVVAADVSARAVACTALTFALLDPGCAAVAVVADVAAGLATEGFDLVVANPPWVPDLVARETPLPLYSAGGPTGFELPTRFLDGTLRLLRPGGRGVMNLLDAEFADGAAPLREAAARLRGLGAEVEVEESPAREAWPDFAEAMARRNPSIIRARHVHLLVRR